MPNGQTDIFTIHRATLVAMLMHRSELALRGLRSHDKPARTFTGAEIAELVQGHTLETITVEEQHGDTYIIHLGADWEHWIEVPPESPLYSDIRVAQADSGAT